MLTPLTYILYVSIIWRKHMILESVYPVIMTESLKEVADFYRNVFGFTTTFESEWYVSLEHGTGTRTFELALLDPRHLSVPEGYGAECRGIIINIEVPDARAEYHRIVDQSIASEVRPLQDEDFGQRHFIIADPAGNLIDVIQNIPPSEDYAKHYSGGADGQR
jgi:uncharacterized glyoxalase superfamily protein PhnB